MADPRLPVALHPIAALRRYTEARIGLGRYGSGLPTAAHLDFAEAHARARDAVHAAFEADAIAAHLQTAGRPCVHVASEAGDRATYLRRPDLGRRLSAAARAELAALVSGFEPPDLAIVIGDGLSARAVNTYAGESALSILKLLPQAWHVAPIVLASGARVALSDPIGEVLGARLVLMLIGERPGLSAADSLGAYLTFAPRSGKTDADRNCVSNIRAGGLAPQLAAAKIAGLLTRARALGLSGVGLKDDEGLIEGVAALPALEKPGISP
ncbi:MAG: ethanolamine ammonia-lyase subunit EutC [Rhizobiaceae bacterium]|nr:ethanolamine ammonia-lyase subunit EutC [Rhizobiaceae bacterium]